ADVPGEIARALQLRDFGPVDVVDALAAGLRAKSILLLLDNFEHVLDAAPVIATLLARAPRLKVMVTSRAPLRISGEHEFPVAPLGVPADNRSFDDVSAFPAVALFVERARAVRRDFTLAAGNAEVIAQICRRVDGLPLAIELAASKVKLLSPEQILDRLGSRLTLLKGGARDLPARQQTLRDTIDWSYELLEQPAARAFRALGVFPGGAALRWALTDGADPILGARIAIRLGWFWYSHGYAVEGSAWLEAAHDTAADLSTDLRAMLLWRFGVLLDQRAEPARATGLFEEAVALYRLLGDEGGTAAALNSWGSAVRNRGDGARARPLWEESLAIRRKLGDEAGQATALYNLGCLELDEGDASKGRSMLEEGLALDTKSG